MIKRFSEFGKKTSKSKLARKAKLLVASVKNLSQEIDKTDKVVNRVFASFSDENRKFSDVQIKKTIVAFSKMDRTLSRFFKKSYSNLKTAVSHKLPCERITSQIEDLAGLRAKLAILRAQAAASLGLEDEEIEEDLIEVDEAGYAVDADYEAFDTEGEVGNFDALDSEANAGDGAEANAGDGAEANAGDGAEANAGDGAEANAGDGAEANAGDGAEANAGDGAEANAGDGAEANAGDGAEANAGDGAEANAGDGDGNVAQGEEEEEEEENEMDMDMDMDMDMEDLGEESDDMMNDIELEDSNIDDVLGDEILTDELGPVEEEEEEEDEMAATASLRKKKIASSQTQSGKINTDDAVLLSLMNELSR